MFKLIAFVGLITLPTMKPTLVFDFYTGCNASQWSVVDDVVMGGRSAGKFRINQDGHGVFSGHVSLENNAGFSSVRCPLEKKEVSAYTKFLLTLKGDGKTYQLRAKSNLRDYYSYVANFETNGEWQTIEISFSEMYPSFRGQKLNMPNYPGEQLEEIAFLIANKKAEDFQLEIDKIEIK